MGVCLTDKVVRPYAAWSISHRLCKLFPFSNSYRCLELQFLLEVWKFKWYDCVLRTTL